MNKLMKYSLIIYFFICNYACFSFASEDCDHGCADEALPYMVLSEHVYKAGSSPSGWSIVRNYSWFDECDFHWNPFNWGYDIACGLSGFYATHYVSDEGKHVLAFRGSQGIVDFFVTDYNQFIVGLSVQYGKAVDITESILESLDGEDLILTGHSLGGGLASYAALLTGLTAYTFNPARLSALNIATNYYNSSAVIKSYIASDSTKKDLVSSIGSPPPNNTDYIVEKPTGWKNYNPVVLHFKETIRSFLYHSVSGGQEPEAKVASYQTPLISYPGGPSMYQMVSGMSPGGTLTLHVKQEETGFESTFTRSLSGDGSWSESYSPPTAKEKGRYCWYGEDDKGKKSDEICYIISDPNSPNPLYGFSGYEYFDSTTVQACLPDFVAKRAWITKSENGSEKYFFSVGDKAWINTKVANEGCADSPQDISVWYFLSKGEKEDNHHEWLKIGTDTIRADELQINKDKWEKEEFTVPSVPGKYNIVACADRVSIYDNGDGDVIEEHKSNDCSSEAVFTVLSYDPSVSLSVYDFWRAHDPIYATNDGGFDNFEARFKIKNNAENTQLIEDMKIDIYGSSGLYKTCWQKNDSTLIDSGEVFELDKKFCEINDAGTYHLEAKLLVDGLWETYQTHPDFVVNNRDIDVLSFTHSSEPIYATYGSGLMNFNTRVQLKNNGDTQITINKLYIAVLLPNGLTKFDCFAIESPFALNPGQVYDSMIQACDIWDPNEYSLQLKLDLGGSLGLLPYQTLPPFEVSDSDNVLNLEAIYRLWNNEITSHYYDNARGVAEVINKYPDWVPEPIAFWTPRPGSEGSVPIYVAWHSDSDPTKSTHFFTISKSQYDSLVSGGNWSANGSNFSAYPTKRPGTVEVYVYNSSSVNYSRIWTTDAPVTNYSCASGKSLNNYPHYCYEGVAWYAFDSIPSKPSVSTLTVSDITGSTALLRGIVSPEETYTSAFFDFGSDSSYGNTIDIGNIGYGSEPLSLSKAISGLSCGKQYFYRIRAINDGGAGYGADSSFSTTDCPAEADQDNDGIPDNMDNCQTFFNHLQFDFDFDGSGDACDEDDDNDLIPDVWEIRYGLNPNNPDDAKEDLDNDGFSNYQEFLNNTNPRGNSFYWNMFLPAIRCGGNNQF